MRATKPFGPSPQHSIFYKIVLTFLCLLLPLCGLNLFMNDSGAGIVRSEIVHSMDGKVELYVDLIESDFDRVIQLIQTYVNDDDLLMLSSAASVMSDVERTKAILSLKRKIDLVKTSSRFVENASAFIPLLDRTVTSNDNSIASFDEAQFEALSATTNRYDAPFLRYGEHLYISVPYPDPALSGGRPPQFLLTVEVSERALRETLKRFANNGEKAVLSSNLFDWAVRSDDGFGAVPAASAPTSGDSVRLDGERYLVVSQSSDRLETTLTIFAPERRIFGPLTKYRTWLLLMSIFSVVVILFFALSLHRIIERPLRTLVRSLSQVEKGNLQVAVAYERKDEFGFLFTRFNAMVRQLNVLVHEVYEQKYLVRLAELRQLQSQINPHFLYNSFFILHRMATLRDNDNIARFTKYLGDYFRYITRDGASNVPLSEEVNNARTYTDIQAFRFGRRIVASFGDPPNEWEDFRVPRLILQPLIENAYAHGLENKTKDGRLVVEFRAAEETLIVVVEDNGEHLAEETLQQLRQRLAAPESAAESTGLLNVHRRLQIMFGKDNGLTLSRGAEGGLRVELRIPRRREGEVAIVSSVDRR
ncbi:histidine kinase [Paenibacillus sp.]|uniref:sensor histidine kinase n=1 Tax=Paenibacillus sp. TaxID=58172 RepID=UPI0028121D9D|nr:histidine kinase [Paenibacillus sp.]